MIFDRGFNLLRLLLPIDIKVKSSLSLLSPAVLITVFDISDNCLLESVLKFCSIIFNDPSIPISSPELFKLSDKPSVNA